MTMGKFENIAERNWSLFKVPAQAPKIFSRNRRLTIQFSNALQVFTEDSITVPTLESTYCNWKSMSFEPFQGHIREVLGGDMALRRGRLLRMWPPKKNGERGGYREGTKEQTPLSMIDLNVFWRLLW